MAETKLKHERRDRRRQRIRKKVFGRPERPRLTVYKSHKHIYGQIVDDMSGKTLVAVSSKAKDLADALRSGGNVEAAKKVGMLLAQKAVAGGIRKVVFDRNGCLYHGRVKALADAAREAGLVF
ncbi:MAG: 50S ribosomal protein L18 [Nitrospirae bacterium]|nr:50S ribosomal protein L18 [Nitrospirota bacterium]